MSKVVPLFRASPMNRTSRKKQSPTLYRENVNLRPYILDSSIWTSRHSIRVNGLGVWRADNVLHQADRPLRLHHNDCRPTIRPDADQVNNPVNANTTSRDLLLLVSLNRRRSGSSFSSCFQQPPHTPGKAKRVLATTKQRFSKTTSCPPRAT